MYVCKRIRSSRGSGDIWMISEIFPPRWYRICFNLLTLFNLYLQIGWWNACEYSLAEISNWRLINFIILLFFLYFIYYFIYYIILFVLIISFHLISDGCESDDDNEMLSFVMGLVDQLREGHKLFIHCWAGRGRTGIIVAILLGWFLLLLLFIIIIINYCYYYYYFLGMLYDIPAMEALQRTNLYFHHRYFLKTNLTQILIMIIYLFYL